MRKRTLRRQQAKLPEKGARPVVAPDENKREEDAVEEINDAVLETVKILPRNVPED